MRHKVLTPPTSEPVTFAEVKEHLRVTHNHEDALITAQIKAARRLCENAVRMGFITQTRQTIFQLPSYSGDGAFFLSATVNDPDHINEGIVLWQNAVSISSFEVYRGDVGTRAVVNPAAYKFDLDARTVEWVPEHFIPLLATNNRLKVVYLCGMSVEAFREAYPDILEAIKITVAVLYDERGYSKQGLPPAAWQFLSPYWTSVTYHRG